MKIKTDNSQDKAHLSVLSIKTKFFSASLDYFGSQLLGLLVSFISFPIILKIFSVEEYGVLSLCNTIVLFGVAFSKLGMQNSAVRYYSEFDCNNKLSVFFRTFAITGTLVGLIFLILTNALSERVLPSKYLAVVWPLALVIFLQTVNSYFVNFLRSAERTRLQAVLALLTRIGGVFGGISLAVWLNYGVESLFIGQATFLLFSLGYLVMLYRKPLRHPGQCFDVSLFCKALRFGLPLMVFELSSIALAFSDRLLITYFNGTAELGVYAAGYTICMYVADLIRQPLGMAIIPIYTRLYFKEGESAASEFVSRVLGLVLVAILPIIAGFLAIHRDLLLALAPSKYIAAVQIMPWVAVSLIIYSLQPLVAAGLYLKKSTTLIAKVSFLCGVLNIGINLIALPTVGIVGAAWATAASYLLALILMARYSAQTFHIHWYTKKIVMYGICSVLMYIFVISIPEGASLVMKILAGILVYSVMVILVDRELLSDIAIMIKGNGHDF